MGCDSIWRGEAFLSPGKSEKKGRFSFKPDSRMFYLPKYVCGECANLVLFCVCSELKVIVM